MTSSTEDSRAASSAPRGTSNGTCASASVRFARTMRCAMVGSGTRKARAISSVVSPPSKPQRERDARLRRQHGMTGDEDQPQQIVADLVVDRGVDVERRRLPASSRARGRSPRACARASGAGGAGRSRDASRSPSATRPGLSGTPVSGHCSSAATSASCARSSARPTSRRMRARPAMSRADSIRQTASIARWVSVACTATDHTSRRSGGASRPTRGPASR